MATVEQAQTVEQTPTNGNGRRRPPASEIPVENPATGEIVATRPRPQRRGGRRDGRSAAAPRSPSWEAYGFEGRGRVLLRAQKWLMDNADQVVATIVSETGKTFEDADASPRSPTPATPSASGPSTRAEYLGDETRQVQPAARQGQEADPALPPARPDRRDRPVELPADELLRRLHPGARRRQQRDPQAVGDHAADLAADGRRAARVRPARERLPGRHRPRRDRRGADRARST